MGKKVKLRGVWFLNSDKFCIFKVIRCSSELENYLKVEEVFFKVIFRRRDEIYENCRNIISKYQQQYVLSNNKIK